VTDPLSISDKYQAALADHKHYDNASLAVATGIVLIPGAVVQIGTGKPTSSTIVIVIVGCLVTSALFLLYRRMADFSSIARQVAAAIEDGTFTKAGPSTVFRDSQIEYRPKRGLINRIVSWLTAISLLCMVVFGALQLAAA